MSLAFLFAKMLALGELIMKKGNLLLLSVCFFSLCLGACQSNSSKQQEKPIEDNVPETGKADRSSLKYTSYLDNYKKSDWKAH